MADDRWEELVAASVGGPVTRGRMFGCEGLRTGRKFFAIWWHDQLVAKLPPDRLARLLEAGKGEQFEPMEGRPMNGWAVVSPSADWAALAAEARAHVEAQQG
jgi:TfoX N-terminal domain